MKFGTLLMMLFAGAYLFATFFAVRRLHGAVTFRRFMDQRLPNPLELLREIRTTGGAVLNYIDRVLILLAHSVILAILLYGFGGILLDAVTAGTSLAFRCRCALAADVAHDDRRWVRNLAALWSACSPSSSMATAPLESEYVAFSTSSPCETKGGPVKSLLVALATRSVELQGAVSTLLETPRHFDLTAMRQRRWVVVPCFDSFSDDEAAALARVAADRGVKSGWALTTEPLVHEEQFEVEVTAEGIVAFDMNCMLRYFLLLAADESFAVLHEANYYWLLAAPRDFVAAVFGEDPEQTLDGFLREVEGDGWAPTEQRLLREMERYRLLLK